MADSSIVATVEIDDKKAQAELNRLGKNIQKLEQELNAKQAQQSTIEGELKSATDAALQTTDRVKELKAELAQLQEITSIHNTSGIGDPAELMAAMERQTQVKAELAEQEKLLAQQDAQAEKLAGKYAKVVDEVNNITVAQDAAQIRAGELSAVVAGVPANFEEAQDSGEQAGSGISAAMEQATMRVERLGHRILGLAKRVFVFSLITKALRGVRTWLWAAIQTNDEAAAAVGNLKGALLTLAQPILQVVIPVFITLVNVLTQVVSAISAVVSALFGTSNTAYANAAKNLNKEQKALKGVGGAAKEATKQLASFDEINKLTAENAGGGGGASDAVEPLFDTISNYKLPDWLDEFLGKLRLNFKDVFIDWGDLNGEQIAKKIIAGLAILAGAVAGFTIGGVPGAIVGALTGAVLGLIFDSLIFDNDGTISKDEILKMLVAAAGALAGGVIGFMIGGVPGAAIGVLVGAGLSLLLTSLLFDSDNKITKDGMVRGLVGALGVIAGAVIGFTVGGPGGAVIGALVGAGISLLVDQAIFTKNSDQKQRLLNTLVTAMAVVAGGALGFAVGGPMGAVIGVTVGAGLALVLNSTLFNKGGAQKNKLMSTLVSTLAIIAGGVIGFMLGGPLGAVIGASVGVGIGLLIKDSIFSEGTKNLKNTIMNSLVTVLAGIVGGVIGFAVGGPLGAAIGATIGVGVTLIAKNVDWSSSSKRAIENASMSTNGFTGIRGTIPALASGAVIPPNREFLAVLGDQSNGTNIETPLETMVEAFRQAMAEGGMNGTITIPINLDGREITRVVVRNMNQMQRSGAMA